MFRFAMVSGDGGEKKAGESDFAWPENLPLTRTRPRPRMDPLQKGGLPPERFCANPCHPFEKEQHLSCCSFNGPTFCPRGLNFNTRFVGRRRPSLGLREPLWGSCGGGFEPGAGARRRRVAAFQPPVDEGGFSCIGPLIQGAYTRLWPVCQPDHRVPDQICSGNMISTRSSAFLSDCFFRRVLQLHEFLLRTRPHRERPSPWRNSRRRERKRVGALLRTTASTGGNRSIVSASAALFLILMLRRPFPWRVRGGHHT